MANWKLQNDFEFLWCLLIGTTRGIQGSNVHIWGGFFNFRMGKSDLHSLYCWFRLWNLNLNRKNPAADLKSYWRAIFRWFTFFNQHFMFSKCKFIQWLWNSEWIKFVRNVFHNYSTLKKNRIISAFEVKLADYEHFWNVIFFVNSWPMTTMHLLNQ